MLTRVNGIALVVNVAFEGRICNLPGIRFYSGYSTVERILELRSALGLCLAVLSIIAAVIGTRIARRRRCSGGAVRARLPY